MTDPQTPPGPRPRRRWPFVLLLLGSLAWLGLALGTAAGARWLVPEGSGLAGPAIALGYGVLGAGAGLVVGALVAWKVPHGLLRGASAVSVGLGLVLAGLVAWRIVTLDAERRAETGMDVPLPPPAGFRVESRIADSDGMRRYREMTVNADAWTATWVAVGPEAATCTAELIFDEADALLEKRAEVRDDPERYAALCGMTAALATHVYVFREAVPDGPSWQIPADARCLQEHPEIAELHWLLGRIPVEAVSAARADCDV